MQKEQNELKNIADDMWIWIASFLDSYDVVHHLSMTSKSFRQMIKQNVPIDYNHLGCISSSFANASSAIAASATTIRAAATRISSRITSGPITRGKPTKRRRKQNFDEDKLDCNEWNIKTLKILGSLACAKTIGNTIATQLSDPSSFLCPIHFLKKLDLSFTNVVLVAPDVWNHHRETGTVVDQTNINRFQVNPTRISLAHLNSLTYLNISGCNNIHDIKKDAVPLSLQEIVLHGCENIKSISELSDILTFVDASECPSFNFSSFSGFSKLQFLYAGDNSVIEKVNFLPKSLIHLDLSNCRNITKIPFDSLPNTLRHLALSRCERLTRIENIPLSLEVLYLRECDSIEFIGFIPPSLPIDSKLVTLDLSGCNKLNEDIYFDPIVPNYFSPNGITYVKGERVIEEDEEEDEDEYDTSNSSDDESD